MIQLNLPDLKVLSNSLQKYDFKNTVSQFAGLLTVPSLQANTVRIDLLVHLATIHCKGKRRARLEQINMWLNQSFAKSYIPFLEDPVENVFISNIATPEGNFRIFEGIWESNDYFLQAVIDTLIGNKSFHDLNELIEPIFALMRLSDCIAERLKLKRWCSDESAPQGTVNIVPDLGISGRARAITFTREDLKSIGVNRKSLKPFILTPKDRDCLREEIIGNSSLERYPLIEFDEELVFALPHAASPAVRRFVLTFLRQLDHLNEFATAIADYQMGQIKKEVLPRIQLKVGKNNFQNQLVPPKPDSQIPSIHSCVGTYDIDKFIHIVLLHDRLDHAEYQGLDSMMQYSDELNENLTDYLQKISNYGRSLPEFRSGTTLIVMGGIGRGFMLGFRNFSDNWNVSIIGISDSLMLAREPGESVTKFLKCMEQRKWTEKQGIEFFNVNGDYNFYCYWRRNNYQLIPRDMRVEDGVKIALENDFVQPVRRDIRERVDFHSIPTTSGLHLPVNRFNTDSFFKSIENRPIYGSLEHFRAGKIAGVVETSRGYHWLVLKPRQADERIRGLLYNTWSGFLELFEKLVNEIETHFPKSLKHVTEICLNFDNVEFPEFFEDLCPMDSIAEPIVTVNNSRQIAEVEFASKFLFHFTQPENKGELLFISAVAKGLMCLHQGIQKLENESGLHDITERVIGNPDSRVLHAFPSYDPVEHFFETVPSDLSFNLPLEDFVFSKLKLANDCAPDCNSHFIQTKCECVKFLNNVVDEVWKRLQILLKKLDRKSVIVEALKVHESKLYERDQWNRTSKALLALHGSEENVVAIAESQESERVKISLSLRTIIEIAICECPKTGGRYLSQWDLDALVANTMLLLEVATDSDAVYKDLIDPPQIEIHENGEYTIDRDYKESIIKPFFADHYEKIFEKNVAEYSSIYQINNSTQNTQVEEFYDEHFLDAFHAEFGFTLQNAIDGFATLFKLAIDSESNVIVTSIGELIAEMSEFKHLPIDVCYKFIRAFGIVHRPKWDQPPYGFKVRDIYPWRYQRRLSTTVRPVLVFGECENDEVIYGVGSMKRGLLHMFHEMERGGFPNEFFESEEMKKYVGRKNDKRGHEFANRVAQHLNLQGWKTCTEVQMKQLGAHAKLGDVDVLAWNSSKQVQVIECKNLRFARTVSEIAEICDRFRGGVEDELGKHVNRIDWIKSNPVGLQKIVGFIPDKKIIEGKLVTSTRVPIMYLESLPIPTDQITTLVDL